MVCLWVQRCGSLVDDSSVVCVGVGVGGLLGGCAWVRVVEEGMVESACFVVGYSFDRIGSLYPMCLRSYEEL